MRANVLARLFLIASLGLAALAWVAPPPAQAAGLQMTAAQTLLPKQLTAEELTFYKTLTNPALARDFILTRSYVRLCLQVVEHKLPAIQLPDRPAGFSTKYLLPEDPNIVNRALGANLAAKERPDHKVSANADLTAAQILKPADLTAQERAYYEKLTNPVTAKKFILTRSYMRLAQKVYDHKMPAMQLPDQPVGFSPRFLLPGEAAVDEEARKQLVTELFRRSLSTQKK